MNKENKNFRRKKNNKKKDPTLNLGIKVGDWFEDISGSKHGFKYFYMVKSLNQIWVRLVEIGIDDGILSEVYCMDYDINRFKKVKNILEVDDELELKKIGEDEARNRLKKVDGISLILECFGVDQKKVSSQNPSSTQSTTPKNNTKTAKDLGIEVGDWFEIPQIYAESNGKERRFLRVENVTDLEIGFKEVNVEPTNPDHTIEVEERPWLIKYFHKNRTSFFWETGGDGRLDFERREIDVVRKEVTLCLNLEIEDVLRDLNLLETNSEKLKKSRYLKYVNGNETYYILDPKYETKKILEQEKFCVVACGITIINNRVYHHSWNDGKSSLLRLVFDNEEDFFNKVTEISVEDFDNLCDDLDL